MHSSAQTHREVSFLSRSVGLAGTLAVLVLFAPRAWAANPESAAYSHDSSRLFWIAHISDSHIGTAAYPAEERLRWALEEAVPVIDPVLTVDSGDLCDGSINGIPLTGQSHEVWSLYRQILDDAAMTVDIFIDIPGNHDSYHDPGNTFYLDYSLNGETFNKLTRSMVLSFPFGDYFIYGTATNRDDGSIVPDAEFSQADLTEMEAELAANDSAELIFVFGHHGIHQPENASQAIQIVQQHKAFYFHGHIHDHGSYIQDDIVVAQVDTLGKGSTDNLAVIAVDNNAVSYEYTSSEDPWPFVVVTAPANRVLHSGEANPYAYEVPTNCTDNPVRALVFDKSTVSAVTFEAAGGQPQPMNAHPSIDHLYVGSWDTSGLSPGETSLTVTAHASQVRGRQITVMLSDLACVPPVEEPDAGVPDGGELEDGSVDTDAATDIADAGEDVDGSVINGSGADSGCNCRSTPPRRAPGAPPFWLALLALLGLGAHLLGRRQPSAGSIHD